MGGRGMPAGIKGEATRNRYLLPGGAWAVAVGHRSKAASSSEAPRSHYRPMRCVPLVTGPQPTSCQFKKHGIPKTKDRKDRTLCPVSSRSRLHKLEAHLVAVEVNRRHHRQCSPEPLVVLKGDHHAAHGLLGFGEFILDEAHVT